MFKTLRKTMWYRQKNSFSFYDYKALSASLGSSREAMTAGYALDARPIDSDRMKAPAASSKLKGTNPE
jgi:hypothetical protein